MSYPDSFPPFGESSQLKQRRLDLERITFCREMYVSRFALMSHDGHDFLRHAKNDLVLRGAAEFAGRRVTLMERRELAFPSDWWQHIKQRWFPAWALRRWPLRFTVHTLEVKAEASALFPEIEPFQSHYKTIVAFDRVKVSR